MAVEQAAAGVPDGWEIVSPGAPPPAPASPPPGPADARMPAGVPARGRGTQLDLDRSNALASAAVTPLAHPTGVDAIDSFTSPIGLASALAGGLGIARAGLSQGVAAAMKAAAAQASPVIKYEAARRIMTGIGLPDAVASPVAMVIAGYKKGGAAATEAATAEGAASVPKPADMNAPHLDTSVPVRPSTLTPQQMAEREAYGVPKSGPQVKGSDLVAQRKADLRARLATPASAAPAPPPPAPEFTSAEGPFAPKAPPAPIRDPLVTIDAEIAARRGGGRPAPPAPANAPADPPAVLVSPETAARAVDEYKRLIRAGKTPAEARDLILQQVELMKQLQLRTPTVAETKFPKGMRGGPPREE